MTLTQSSASDLADQRTRQVLLTQPSVQQLVIDSPPGAGKTGVAERVAVQGAWLQGEKVMIATQTKAQSLDLVERLASGWPSREVYLFAKQGMNIPDEIKAMGNAKVITSLNSLPSSPHIVVANAAKWSYAKECHFDLLIVDEAYQLRDSQFIQIAGLALRLLERGTEMLDDGQTIALTPQQIGVVCAHRSQVYSVQQRLGKELEGVYVETADRYQGLERRVMIAHHPLSGRMTLSDFQLDSGRLCVMTSRHRVCCFLLARAGLAERLGALSPSVERVLGLAEDPTHQGRYAHRSLLQKLSEHKRIVPVSLS